MACAYPGSTRRAVSTKPFCGLCSVVFVGKIFKDRGGQSASNDQAVAAETLWITRRPNQDQAVYRLGKATALKGFDTEAEVDAIVARIRLIDHEAGERNGFIVISVKGKAGLLKDGRQEGEAQGRSGGPTRALPRFARGRYISIKRQHA
jgi:hypothetical protein